MRRFVHVVLITLGLGVAFAADGAERVGVCSLVSKEEVRQHLPWTPLLDAIPVEEEPVGASGSACNYPSVYVQVLPFSQGTLDTIRGMEGIEAVSGVGEDAYFRNNAGEYAELFVKTGEHLLTLQANVVDSMESVKRGVVDLAKVFVTKLGAR